MSIETHVANMLLTVTGHSPADVRRNAERVVTDPDMVDVIGLEARADLSAADIIADALAPHLLAFRELVAAAEEAGLEGPVLDRARQAHAALTGWTS
jgi:hypothetical protein